MALLRAPGGLPLLRLLPLTKRPRLFGYGSIGERIVEAARISTAILAVSAFERMAVFSAPETEHNAAHACYFPRPLPSDPNLFAHHFRDKSWDGWKVFLRALFADPADEAGLAVYRRRTGRTTWPTAPFTEAAVIVGRRGGKSRTLALIAVYLAAFRDYAPYLAPGEVATIVVMAVDKGQARVIFRFVLGLLKAVPMLEPLIVKSDGEKIELSNRVLIEIATASFRSTRGYSYAAVLADELAFWRSDETSLNPDVEILRAVRPGLATIPGAMLVMASISYGQARRALQRLSPLLRPGRRGMSWSGKPRRWR